MLAKASTLPADAVVFDLEDSVPSDQRDAARTLVRDVLATWEGAAAPFVRINSPLVGMVAQDAEILDGIDAGIVVPKIDIPAQLEAIFSAIDMGDREMIVTLETPRSLLRAEAIADTPGVDGLFLGGEDLTNTLGSRRTAQGAELSWARHVTLIAARAANIAAYDTICPEFQDLDTLERDCITAAEMGFDGKFAIHPSQIPVIHRAFSPTESEIDHARRVVAAFDDALAHGQSAVALDGQMIDPPVADRARSLLARAGRAQQTD